MNESFIAGSVISTRIRLARNFSGVPFSPRMTVGQASVITEKVSEVLGERYKTYSLSDLGEVESGTLVEKHLISKELLSSPYGTVIVNDDEEVSVMLCEEDHLRLQVIKKGLRLDQAYDQANRVDDIIGSGVKYSFDQKLGYLTACPSNLGTGMRASVMMFLPALTIMNTLSVSIKKLEMLNITIRGVYGEGSEALGYLYQVSNQHTLGISEQEILTLVRSAVGYLCEAEEQARVSLLSIRENDLYDEILRSVGTAKYAYKMSNHEFVKLASMIKLGAYYGLVNITDEAEINELITAVQPFNLVASADRHLRTAEERDIYRAKIVRSALQTIIKE